MGCINCAISNSELIRKQCLLLLSVCVWNHDLYNGNFFSVISTVIYSVSNITDSRDELVYRPRIWYVSFQSEVMLYIKASAAFFIFHYVYTCLQKLVWCFIVPQHATFNRINLYFILETITRGRQAYKKILPLNIDIIFEKFIYIYIVFSR